MAFDRGDINIDDIVRVKEVERIIDDLPREYVKKEVHKHDLVVTRLVWNGEGTLSQLTAKFKDTNLGERKFELYANEIELVTVRHGTVIKLK